MTIEHFTKLLDQVAAPASEPGLMARAIIDGLVQSQLSLYEAQILDCFLGQRLGDATTLKNFYSQSVEDLLRRRKQPSDLTDFRGYLNWRILPR